MIIFNKHPNIKIVFHILLISIAVWVSESCVHAIIFSRDSFWEAMFLNVSTHEFYTRILGILTCCVLYLLLIKNKIIQETEKHIENILNSVIPVCITNRNYEIIMANDSYWHIWGKPESKTLKCYDHRPGGVCHTEECALTQIINGIDEFTCESQKIYNGENHYFIVTARPFLDAANKRIGVIESFQDITDRKKLEDEKTILVTQLQSSLEQVKLLSGLLPICSVCKNIKNDQGDYEQIERYIHKHSGADFSHTICPKCADEMYSGQDWYDAGKKKGEFER